VSDILERLFTVNHSIPLQIRSVDEQQDDYAYFYPPTFAFLPREFLDMNDFELPWLYTLWHEMQHLEGLGLCSLEMYESAMDDVSQDLLLMGISALSQDQTKVGLKAIWQGIELAKKRRLIGEYSSVVREILPTFIQIYPGFREKLASSITKLVPPFMDRNKLNLDMVTRFVTMAGERFTSYPETGAASEDHRLAYGYGKRIFEQTGAIQSIKAAAGWAMDVNLSKVDIVGIGYQSFRSLFEKSPNEMIPNLRIRELLQEPSRIGSIEWPPPYGAERGLYSIFQVISSPTLPESIQDVYSKKLVKSFETGRSVFEQYGAEKFTDMGVSMMATPAGLILVMSSSFLAGVDWQSFVQRGFAKSYACELVLRLFGYRRYPESLLSPLRDAANRLTFEVDEPNYIHIDAERWIRQTFPKNELDRIIPVCSRRDEALTRID
jgi:hypothetical protein